MSEYFLKHEKDNISFYCPACKQNHMINSGWNIDIENKTVSPSVLVKFINSSDEWGKDENGDYIFIEIDGVKRTKGYKNTICHSFIRNGKIQYLNDCTHELAGKTIDMEKID